MVLWLIYFLLSLFFMILCYVTNPFVVPFADINGELPSFLHYWQTWDNSVFCIPNFTLWERIQRYCCGTLWLTRNCSYGFAFYLLGLNISPNLEIRQSENTIFVREIFSDGLFGAWMYKNTAPIFSAFGYTVHWNNLIGWKIDTDAKFDTRAMIANRIAFYFEKEGE